MITNAMVTRTVDQSVEDSACAARVSKSALFALLVVANTLMRLVLTEETPIGLTSSSTSEISAKVASVSILSPTELSYAAKRETFIEFLRKFMVYCDF
jgi:hypothetical protein